MTAAVRWSCERCGVSVGRIDGSSLAMPATWTRLEENTFCLGCSRALAQDAAAEEAPSDTSREDLTRLRRRALIEFEIERTPGAPNRAIAQACHTSIATVNSVRGTSGPAVADAPRPGAG